MAVPAWAKVRRLDADGQEIGVDKEVRAKMTGPQKLALLLAETELVVLTASDVKEQDRTEPYGG